MSVSEHKPIDQDQAETEPSETIDASVSATNALDDTAEAGTTLGEAELNIANPEAVLNALETTRAELADMKEQFLRAHAESENIRRRSELEISKARKFAVVNFASELLSVKDSLDLAAKIDLGEQADGVVKSMHEGLGLTLRQLDGVFDKFGVNPVLPEVGEKLNPELHQAMTLQESADVAPNHILSVIQPGFTLNERLLRPAMVIVAKAPQSA